MLANLPRLPYFGLANRLTAGRDRALIGAKNSAVERACYCRGPKLGAENFADSRRKRREDAAAATAPRGKRRGERRRLLSYIEII